MAIVVCSQCGRPVSSDQHRCFCGAVLKRDELLTPEVHRHRTMGRRLRIEFAGYLVLAALMPWLTHLLTPPNPMPGFVCSTISAAIAAVIWWFRLGHLLGAVIYGVPMIVATALLFGVGILSMFAWLALLGAGMGLSLWACGRREMS